MKWGKLLWVSLAGGLAAAAYAKPARAQAADEYVMIVLDQTGSMNQSGIDLGDGTPHGSIFDNAVSAAQSWIQTDAGSAGTRRAYSIWTFKDDNCCGGKQAGLLQVWPKVTSTDCAAATGGAFEAATGYCLFAAGGSLTPYGALSTTLDTIRPLQPSAGGGTIGGDTESLLSLITIPATVPKGGAEFDPAFGLGPNTPLASSLCDAVERLQLVTATKNRTIILETDGGENFSTGGCSGAVGAGLATGVNTFPKSQPDWGLTPVASWQVSDMRRLTRLISFPPVTGGIAANGPNDLNAIAKGPITTPPDDVPAATKWRIDVHFSLCSPTFPALLPCVTTAAAAAFAPAALAVTGPSRPLEGVSTQPMVVAPVATASLAAAAAPVLTPSIAPGELSFFTALGHVTPQSSFRAIVRDPTVKFGTTHRLAGDVDDSGCVDNADFKIVTQKDVYFQRAVQPNQLAIRADLNADGWVNRQDAQIVLNNWARGCINGVGPKPKIP